MPDPDPKVEKPSEPLPEVEVEPTDIDEPQPKPSTDIRDKIGFWAQALPTETDSKKVSNKTFTGKPKN